MTTFRPKIDILPPQQRQLWPALAGLPSNFVLYGGTALALRLGHRNSVDFDFFCTEALDAEQLLGLPFARGADVLQRQPDTLTLSVAKTAPVKVSFFGGIDFGRVGDPQRTADGVLVVASLLDLFATKLKVLLQRIQRRDYQDLAASARRLAPSRWSRRSGHLVQHCFPPMEAAKTLVYFSGDATNVDAADRRTLTEAVATGIAP